MSTSKLTKWDSAEYLKTEEDIINYIEACLEKEITSLRIIHGKGKGVLRRTVHSILEKHHKVKSYRLANDSSSWGATLVELEL